MLTPGKMTAALLMTAGAFLAGNLASRRPAESVSLASSRQILYWACPMHPQYKSDHPGDAPCCGMRLEPVYAGGGRKAGAASAGPPGIVRISAAKQQLIGVRTDVVQRASSSYVLRIPGRITVDDTRLFRLTAATDGWVRELGRNPAGTLVKQNQVLASYYVRDLVATQQNYLYAFQANAQLEQTQPNIVPQRNTAGLNVRLALDALRSLGMTDAQIAELQRTRESALELRLYSPANGFVLARNISPGQRFDKGTELYRIADISHVWVMADIFEKDREFLKPGAMAMVRYRGREFHARLSDALPQFDPQSRTLKTRFELDNPGYLLEPDMFVDVVLPVEMPAAVLAPADAILEGGRGQTVFVEHEAGVFEPRRVQTGWRLGDRVQIVRGLAPGERIVVSGNFLLDSETRMKSVTSLAMAATQKDPVCGMDVDPAKSGGRSEHKGETYYFCSASCKQKFDRNQEAYLGKQQLAKRRE